MNNILEMREKRAKLWDAAKAFGDTHKAADGTMSAEDKATWDKMADDIDRMGKEIERLEREEAIDIAMNKAVDSQISGRPVEKLANEPEKIGRASKAYNEGFWQCMRNKAHTVSYEVRNALEVGTDSEGGYLVPDEFERTLVQALEEENIFRKLAHVIRTSSGDRKIPVVTTHGTAAWTDEEGAYYESDEAFGQTSLGAHKLTTMIKISEELLHDSVFDLPSYISREFARRIGAAEEEAFFTGNGTGKPLGILANKVDNVDVGAQVAVTTAGNNPTMDEVLDLYYGLKAPYRRKAVFVMNDSTIKVVRKLKDGQGQYLWQPSVQAGQPDRLLNAPIHTSSFMPTIESGAKAILFGDLSYYWIADREGRKFKRLDELFATTGQVGFIASQRVDGKMILPEAAQVLKIKP